MATDDRKITQLNSLLSPDPSDLLAIVDYDLLASETKSITIGNLLGSPTPIGDGSPNTGKFTSLELPGTVTPIVEFSTDGTLSGDSDDAVPTEQAVRTFVEAHTSIPDRIVSGDSKAIAVDLGADSTQHVIFQVEDFGTTVDTIATYYFDGHSAVSTWLNPDDAFNGTPGSPYSRTNVYPGTSSMTGNSNTCGSTDLGDITKVELRVYGFTSGPNVGSLVITPIIQGTTSIPTTVTSLGTVGSPSYSASIDITNYSGAPSNWIWSTVQNLDVIIEGTVNDSTSDIHIALIEIKVTYDATDITTSLGSTEKGKFTRYGLDTDGITIGSAATIIEITNDITLSGDNETSIPTEHAVKKYVDNEVSRGEINVRHVSSDSTAINGDVLLVDTTSGDVTIYLDLAINEQVSVKKLYSDNQVIVMGISGKIDGISSKTWNTANENYTFVNDGTNAFIL